MGIIFHIMLLIPCNSVKINDFLWWFGTKHTVCPCTGGVCVHVCTARSWMHWHFLHRHASRATPSSAHGSYCWLVWRTHFCCFSLLEKTQNRTTQHTWASSFTDSQHQVRKEMLFHGEFSFCNKSIGNSGLCCGLTRRSSQTPQMRLDLRAKERKHYYYYDCKSEWMNATSSCPHITFPVLCLAWVWAATVLYIHSTEICFIKLWLQYSMFRTAYCYLYFFL